MPLIATAPASIATEHQTPPAIVDIVDANAPEPVPFEPSEGDVSTDMITIVDSTLDRIAAARAITPQPENVFGETVDPMNRNLRFFQTDVLLRGTGPDIAISRSLDVNASRSTWWQREQAFADWRLELPRMSTFTPHPGLQAPWSVAGTQPAKRCSSFGLARDVVVNGYNHPASEWWQGVQLTIPGQGSQEVLRRAPQNTLTPNMMLNGNPLSFPLVTSGHWMIACLPATSNGAAGEAFLAVSPNGEKYWFDRLVTGGWEHFQLPFQIGFSISRFEAMMLPSRIEDRNGNALTLTYDGARLTGITATDGRAISLTWQSVNNISFITAITEQPGDPKARIWNYSYLTPGPGRTLNKVTLPDGNKWTFDFNQMTKYCSWWTDDPNGPNCSDNPGALGPNTGTAISPSGITGTFRIYAQLTLPNFPSPLPADCLHIADPYSVELFPVVAGWRRYEGPGIDQTWFYDTCPQGDCQNLANLNAGVGHGILMETDPSGMHTVQAVNQKWCDPLQGEVTKIFVGAVFDDEDGFVSAAQIIDLTKAAPTTGPFPARIGTVPQTYANRAQLEYLRPLQQRDILQDGVIFTWKAETFDAYGQPVRVKRTSTPGTTRTDTTTYNNNTSKWLLGRVASITEQSTNAVPFAQTFDAATGNVLTQSVFGKLAQTLAYNPNGTIKTITDAGGATTTYASYKRGLPQSTTYADGSTTSAVVDNLAQVTSTTDAMGFTTAYTYDLAGRLNQITHPGADITPWHPETFVFERMLGNEYGLGLGHWRRTVSNGNRREVTYYDARWNPVLTRAFDNTNPDATDRFIARRFDHAGRQTFISYPTDSATTWNGISQGIRTTHDALGRPTLHEQDSELGVLTTTTTYAAPLKTQVTNPRGFTTTTTYQTFDQPSYDAPLVISGPAGQTTTVTRDIFGKPTALKRSGTWNNSPLSATRSFVYDAHQRLCKTVEPESGATVLAYTPAGDIAWQATGQSLTSTTACNQANVPATAKSTRSYDALHRLLGIDHPGSTADVGYTWFPDGAMKTATSGTNTWTYTYNKRRLLESESLALDGRTFLIDWGYNPQGNVTNLVYPSGLGIPFNPTVFGEPRQAGTYATAATYLPNGGLDGFTYGNGAVRDIIPNLRQLPDRIRDTKNATTLLDHTLDYDANGNLFAILDGTPGGLESRTLGYDARDRLTSVTGAPTGTETYAYDPLDNIRQAKHGSRDRRYHYHPTTHRLDRIASPSDVLEAAYTWNARGELATRTQPIVPSAPPSDILFGDGFETPATTHTDTFVFGAARRLVQVGTITYAYDAHGRRVASNTPAAGTRYQIYSRSGQLLYVDDSARDQRIDYVYLGTTPVARRTRPLNTNTATTTYLHVDHRGTPSVESNGSGAMTLRSRLNPWGEPYDGAWREGPGLTGHATDEHTRLVYMQQRYYDPLAMRFLSTDPIGASAGSFNRYWYANNNPYTFIDPDGRWACEGAFCATFEAAMARATNASMSGRLSVTEQAALQRAVMFYGAAGDDKVQISFARLGGELGQQITDESGRGRIRFDVEGIELKNPSKNGLEHGLAMRLLHEGDHAARTVAEGFPNSRDERTDREKSAYRSEGYYQKATEFLQNGNNIWAPWNPGDGMNGAGIDARAKFSVEKSCSESAEGSCQ